MRYIGTIQQGKDLEDYLHRMGNFTPVWHDKIKPVWLLKPSAYTNVYEVYLHPEAKRYAQNPDDWFKLLDFPSATIRIAFFERDNRSEVGISPKSIPMICAVYPIIAEILAKMQYAGVLINNSEKIVDHSHAKV